MSRDSVTTDLAVLRGWPKPTKKKPWSTSAEVAAALSLTVFQITARLKGMEGRKLVYRPETGMWGLTGLGQTERDNPSPSLVAKPKVARLPSTNGSMVGPPDDSGVKTIRLGKGAWCPNDWTITMAQESLPLIKRRIEQLKGDGSPVKVGARQDIARLQTEADYWAEVLRKAKNGGWSSRTDRSGPLPVIVYVSPDGREYINARMFETADLIMVTDFKGKGDGVRLRLLTTSSTAKKLHKQQAEQSARETAKKEEQQNARQARVLKAEQEAREEAEAIRHRGHGGSKRKAGTNKVADYKEAVYGKVRPASKAATPEVKRGPAKADRGTPKKPVAKAGLHRGGDRSGKSAPGRAKDRGRALHSGAVVRNKKGRQ